MSEELLVRHCSPTLAGIKTGNMFTMPYTTEKAVNEDIRRLNKILVPKGLRALPLRYVRGRVLIYIYRPKNLKKDLSQKEAFSILKCCGYESCNPDKCIVKLIKKLRCNEEFPHEIGLFLGYPPEDVRGFIENKAEHCKFTGFWKVYGDENKARKLFAKYKKCTNAYYCSWTQGKSIERLTVAV